MVKKKNVGFLQRWSSKKILDQKRDESEPISRNEEVNFTSDENSARNEGKYEGAHSESEMVTQLSQKSLEGLSDKEVLEKLKLPNPETMKAGDDFKAFLAKAVPEHIRKKALRKLWISNPILANLDGMNEYDDDFTLATSALEKFATNYVVGKGFRGQFKAEDLKDGDDFTNGNLKSSSIRVSDKAEEKTENSNMEKEADEDQTNEKELDDLEEKPSDFDQEDLDSGVDSGQFIYENDDSGILIEEEEQPRTLRIKARKMVFKD